MAALIDPSVLTAAERGSLNRSIPKIPGFELRRL